MEGGDAPTRFELEYPRDHLPPADAAPILKYLEPGPHQIGWEEFRERFSIPTPVHPNGLVDYERLVYEVSSLVDPEYKWLSPFFDEHHLYWPAADYALPTREYESVGENAVLTRSGLTTDLRFSLDNTAIKDFKTNSKYKELAAFADSDQFDPQMLQYFAVADEFRELATNKLWVPRQFHSFVHAVTIPAEQPSYEVMKHAVKEARRREYLFRIAHDAMTIREKLDRAEPMPLPNGETLLVDKLHRRVYRHDDQMEWKRQFFIQQIFKHHYKGQIDLTEYASLEEVNRESVEASLSQIALRLHNTELVRTNSSSRARPVNIPFQPVQKKIPIEREEKVA